MSGAPVHPAFEQRWNAQALAGDLSLPAVHVWRYDRPAVVLGRAQRIDTALAARAAGAGVELVERASGGGAVLVGPWLLGASVVLPPEHRLVGRNIAASYGWLGELLAAWLREQGLGGAQRTERPVAGGALAWACFAGLSHGEVEVGGRKIVGLAQARRRGGTLFAAGLLVAPTPWERLCDVMGHAHDAAPALAARTASCAELGVLLASEDVAPELEARLASAVRHG